MTVLTETNRNTSGFKIFLQGGLIDAQPIIPMPIALCSTEAEHMGSCNLGAMVCHLNNLKCDFEKLGCEDYNVENSTPSFCSFNYFS